MTRLTARRLRAIEFAVDHMLAGDVDATLEVFQNEPPRERVTSADLHSAAIWAAGELERRRQRKGDV